MNTGRKFLCFEVRGAAFQMASAAAKYKNGAEYGPTYNDPINGVARHTLLKSHVSFRDQKGFMDVDKIKEVVGWRQIAGLYLRLMSGGTMRLMSGDASVLARLPPSIKNVLSYVREHTSLVDFNIGDREFVVLRQVKNKRMGTSGSPNCCYAIPGDRVTYDVKMLLEIPASGELASALSAITSSPFPLSIGRDGFVSVYEFTPSEFFTLPNSYTINALEKLMDYTDVGDIYACVDGEGGLNVTALEEVLKSFADSAFGVVLPNINYATQRNVFMKALEHVLKTQRATDTSRLDDLIEGFKKAIDKKLTGTINQVNVDDNGAIKDDITLGRLCAEVYAEEMAEVQTLVSDLDALLSEAQRIGPKILKRIMRMAASKIATFKNGGEKDENYKKVKEPKKEEAFKNVTTETTLKEIAEIVRACLSDGAEPA